MDVFTTIFDKVFEGLKIFEKYPTREINAEHDQIWAGPADGLEVSEEDAAHLKELGWFFDDSDYAMEFWGCFIL